MKNKMSIEILLIRIYILIIIFEGPIRYVLNMFGMTTLIYIKDFVLIVLIILGIKKIKFNRKSFIFFIMISTSFIISTIYIRDYMQISFFILKIFVPFLAGMLQFRNILEDMKNRKRFYIVCYIIVVLGVYINTVINYPWEGLEYELGNNKIIATINWSTMGQKRIAGFARSSFNVATYIMVFAILIQSDKKKNKIIRAIYCIITISAIALTTTKGMLITAIVFYINDFLNIEKIKKLLISALIVAMITIPIFSTICDPLFDFLRENMDYEIYIKYFNSFRDRLTNTWPDALQLATKHANIILGRGMGGIGVSQKTYEPDLYSPGDNMFVYLYVTFGLFSLLIYYWIIKFVKRIDFKNQDNIIVYNIIFIICTYGIVSNIVEEPFLCILFGSCIGYSLKKSIGENNENINS